MWASVLIAAMPAAALLADSQSVESAQNGPLMAYVPTRTRLSRHIVTTRELVNCVASRLMDVSASGMAVLRMRSPERSARRPHSTMVTEAIANGMPFSRPVCIVDSPNDLRICGCHRESALLVAE